MSYHYQSRIASRYSAKRFAARNPILMLMIVVFLVGLSLYLLND